MSKFKLSEFDFGEIKYPETNTITWEFFFKEPCKDYHYTNTGSYCTQMKEIDINNKLKGELSLGLAGIPETPGTHEVTKTITVYYDPKIPEYSSNALGVRVPTASKPREELTIRGFVVVS